MVKGRVVILGSGTMACQIGAYLAGRGVDVAWVSAAPDRRQHLRQHAERTMRRCARSGVCGNVCVWAPEEACGDHVMCIIEATREALEFKRAAVASVAHLLSASPLLVSTSSSILPAQIHETCVGLHFFAPVALTGCAELIMERGRPMSLRDRAQHFAAQIGIETVIQDEHSAFAVNRLLLPLQNEAMVALAAGMPAEQVDSATAVFDGTRGQLSMIDHVGWETVAAAVAAYRSRMSEPEAGLYAPLENTLVTVQAMGKRGSANHDGFRERQPLPGHTVPRSEEEYREFALCCRGLVVNQALRFERDGVMDRRTADMVWSAVYGAPTTLSQWLEERQVMQECARALARAYAATRKLYFEPLGVLAELARAEA